MSEFVPPPMVRYRVFPGDVVSFEYVITTEVRHSGGDRAWEEMRKDTTRRQVLEKTIRRLNEFFESIEIRDQEI